MEERQLATCDACLKQMNYYRHIINGLINEGSILVCNTCFFKHESAITPINVEDIWKNRQ